MSPVVGRVRPVWLWSLPLPPNRLDLWYTRYRAHTGGSAPHTGYPPPPLRPTPQPLVLHRAYPTDPTGCGRSPATTGPDPGAEPGRRPGTQRCGRGRLRDSRAQRLVWHGSVGRCTGGHTVFGARAAGLGWFLSSSNGRIPRAGRLGMPILLSRLHRCRSGTPVRIVIPYMHMAARGELLS